MDWLADGVLAALGRVPGSLEREHVTALLRNARRIRLEDPVAAAAADTAAWACGSIGRHLDRLVLRSHATWIEFGHMARAADRIGDLAAIDVRLPDTVGCLVACDPSDEAHAAVFTAWRTALGAVGHAFALMHWDCRGFAALAAAAPRRDDGAAADRLLAAARAAVPPGFLAELEILTGTAAANDSRRDHVLRQTLRDATGEHAFLLAALLMLETPAVRLSRVPALPDAAAPGPAEEWQPRDWPAGDAVPANGAGGAEPAAPAAGEPPDWWVARLARPARRWPWMAGGFRTAPVSGALAWAPPRPERTGAPQGPRGT
jgi:hypothetical protein